MLSDAVDNVLTGRIIKCFYEVYNNLAYGYLEKVYENALRVELENAGLKVVQQKPINVYYRGKLVGEYFVDLFVEDSVMVELKSVSQLIESHENQLVNYIESRRKPRSDCYELRSKSRGQAETQRIEYLIESVESVFSVLFRGLLKLE